MSRLKQKQSQRQSLSPQQIIQANLLQLNISALENRILDELESNPVLDQSLDNEDEETLSEQEEVDYEDDPDEYEPANIYDNKNKEDRDIPIAEQIDFIEGLVNQLIGLNLKDTSKFAFLLSIPTILGALVLMLAKGAYSISFSDMLIMLTGFIGSALIAFFTIKSFLQFVEKIGMTPFVLYRVALGLVLLLI